MRIVVTRDLDEFAALAPLAAPFLAAAVGPNILATVLEHARRGASPTPDRSPRRSAASRHP